MSVWADLESLECVVESMTVEVGASGASPPQGRLGDSLLRLGRVVERLAVLRATWSEAFERESDWAADGARSGAAWVAARSVEHPASARGRVHAGRDLAAVPEMAAAALRGEVRLGHVRLLVTAARSKEHRWVALAEVEQLATESAGRLPEPAFARFVARWAALADADHDAALRAQGLDVPVIDHSAVGQAERREVFLSRYGSDGMWALSGTLDTETGMSLSMALEAVSEAIRGDADPDRSLAQLRHDALAVLLSGQLSAGLPIHKGVRPHLIAIVRAHGPGPVGGTRHPTGPSSFIGFPKAVAPSASAPIRPAPAS